MNVSMTVILISNGVKVFALTLCKLSVQVLPKPIIPPPPLQNDNKPTTSGLLQTDLPEQPKAEAQWMLRSA